MASTIYDANTRLRTRFTHKNSVSATDQNAESETGGCDEHWIADDRIIIVKVLSNVFFVQNTARCYLFCNL